MLHSKSENITPVNSDDFFLNKITSYKNCQMLFRVIRYSIYCSFAAFIPERNTDLFRGTSAG